MSEQDNEQARVRSSIHLRTCRLVVHNLYMKYFPEIVHLIKVEKVFVFVFSHWDILNT